MKPTLNKYVPANHQTGEVYDVKEYNKEYYKEYNEKNKEAIKVTKKEYSQKEIHCPCCNHMIRMNDRSRHNKTKKHITNSNSSDTPTLSESDGD